jgi:hypothetical protein
LSTLYFLRYIASCPHHHLPVSSYVREKGVAPKISETILQE